MSREAMQMALEALETVFMPHHPAVIALREWLVQPEQEPVAWANSSDLQNFDMKVRTGPDLHHTVPLYTAPPKREWVGLTDEEIAQGLKESWVTEQAWQSAVWWAEAKLKEKNHG